MGSSKTFANFTDEQTVRAVLLAGTDVDCGPYVNQHIAAAMNQSLVNISMIEQRLRNLFRVRFRLSHFDPLGPLDRISPAEVCSAKAQALSLDGTRQSAALLKNSNATLPLNRSTVGVVAVIGPAQDAGGRTIAGYYGPQHTCYYPKFPGVIDALSSGGKVKTQRALGVPTCDSTVTKMIPAAVNIAKSAGEIVLAIGVDKSMAAEGHDLKNIRYLYCVPRACVRAVVYAGGLLARWRLLALRVVSDPLPPVASITAAQTQLIEQVAAASKKPIVILLITANPLDISSLLANPKVGAVLHLGQPSTTVLGIEALIYGDASPAGRLTQTIYSAAYQEQISIFDFNMRPGPSLFARPDCSIKVWTMLLLLVVVLS